RFGRFHSAIKCQPCDREKQELDDEPCIFVDELSFSGKLEARMEGYRLERTPSFKLGLTIAVGLLLAIPLFSLYLLNYDRQSQSREATESITAGWGAAQTMTGPLLVIPYRATATETVVQNGQSVTRTNQVTRELTLAPEAVDVSTDIRPEVRKRSIY